ncbi:MAG: O-antigen ligase family protein [Bacteroidetes bacterium]|nr:O-antigen ligase family protein [Bacteroidota bacterium]
MKNKPVKKQPIKPSPLVKQLKIQLKPSYYILLMAYIFVSVFTPNLGTLDTNGDKFFAISLINLAALIIFIFDSDFKKNFEIRLGFFKNLIGIAYVLFLIFSLFSFINAINRIESLMNIVKIFTIFTSTYVIYVILRSDRRYLLHIAIALVILLLIDCFTVFYGILKYINGKVDSIYEIKSVYSNKNMFASALFVKLQIAIFLMYFTKGWQKYLGYLAVFCAILSTLFLSTRAFYLGLGLMLIALLLFAIIRYIAIKKKDFFIKLFHYTALLLISVVVFNFTQHYLYPSKKDVWNTDLSNRLSTINSEETSVNHRLVTWKRSFELFKEHPLIGVGTGNWKICIMKYENKDTGKFQFMLKNHNDFIEIFAETGALGGLAFLSVFFLIIFGFIRTSLKPTTEESKLKFLFFPAMGIFAYSIDAFFNFPSDRPEIQVLFAIFAASAVAFIDEGFFSLSKGVNKSYFLQLINRLAQHKWVMYFMLLLIFVSSYILYLNVISLKYQFSLKKELNMITQPHSAAYYIDGLPSIPNLSCEAWPLAVNKAYYLINENKAREAITILLKDNASPYDSRRESHLAWAYDKLGMKDSSLYWAEKAYLLKPLQENMVTELSSKLFIKGRYQQASQILATYLKTVKDNSNIWISAANQYWQLGQKEKATLLLDSAILYLPSDTNIIKQRNLYNSVLRFSPYDTLYDRAIDVLKAKQYSEAYKMLTYFISKKPDIQEAYMDRALCLFYLHDYVKSLMDIDKAIKKGIKISSTLLEIRGINNYNLGNKDAACADFKASMDKGDSDAANEAAANYQKYCQKATVIKKN